MGAAALLRIFGEMGVNVLQRKRGELTLLAQAEARKQAEETLLKAGALQNAIFNSANFSSIATDARGVIQIFNVGAERMLGYAAAEVMNKITPADISDPQEVIARAKALSLELGTKITPGFEALVFKASRGIEDIYELTYVRKDGSRFPAVVSVTALRDAQNVIIGYLLIGTDNTARKQIEAERMRLDQALQDKNAELESARFEHGKMLEALALTDPLTGLANRRLLADRISLAIIHARRNQSVMALVYLDLDGFKQINDRLGHGAGDAVLKIVATRVVAAVRKGDTVARMGGDEFMVVLWQVNNADDATTVASKVIAALAQPCDVERHAVSITASAGVALYPGHGEDADTLMNSADLALLEAKRAGKNIWRIRAG